MVRLSVLQFIFLSLVCVILLAVSLPPLPRPQHAHTALFTCPFPNLSPTSVTFQSAAKLIFHISCDPPHHPSPNKLLVSD